ncbi:putative suppressor of lurcher protein 1 [Daphnia sinensis]|uniref:Suppressor of lurcher protein 1 n=1 Tax=Daphnia sinensis TaxID=1820382 RepID=A0AAD5PUZ0_9CRUS|nr:putative suppressor of lurcher protein 1 [Daphnia sinensis]
MMEFAMERGTPPGRIWTAFAALLLPFLVGVGGAIIHPGCECVEYSSTFGQPFGQFTSPDFPKPYDPGIGCVLYTFTAPVASASGPAVSWIVELTITNLNLPPTSTCGDGDHLALYLHLDQGEVNERTPSNGRLCSLPAKRSGRYGSQSVRYYSAKSSLVLAFHTSPNAKTADHHVDGGSSLSAASNATHAAYGFKGTYRFIRKSKFRSGGQRISGTVCDYQFISGGAVVSRHDQPPSTNKFYSPLYPSLYPARSRCLYHFYGSCLWSEDGVKVYDGGDVQSPVIAHLCGVTHHAELWSSSSSLLVEFYSSNSSEHTFEGFEGRYSFLPAARGADEYDDVIDEEDEDEEEEDDEDGFIVHPPGVTSSTTRSTPTTPVGTTTTTTRRRTSMTTPTTARTSTSIRPTNVTTPSIRRVQVASSTKPTSTSTSRTTSTSTTTRTTLKQTTLAPRTSKLPLMMAATTTAATTSEVSDAQSNLGLDTNTTFISVGGNKEKIDDFCGSGTPRELMSNSAVMSLHFHSTAVSRGSRGFKARYSFVSNFGITTGEQISSSPCAFRFNSTTSTNGTFWSPNFPGFYPRDTECHYFFHAQVGERVKIVFSYFDIEGMIPCGLTSASDFVEVSNFMTVDRKLPRYCGLQKDLKMESDGAFFRVTFKSNDRFDGTGFFASYQFTPVADAVTITRRRSSAPASRSPYPVGSILLFYLLAYLIS